ncbi:hypothetical protein A2U01_0041888, partial [Trifolium medium]|nr:hypothetical protein [Trifolium medium]
TTTPLLCRSALAPPPLLHRSALATPLLRRFAYFFDLHAATNI